MIWALVFFSFWLILQMKAEFFKNSNFDQNSDFDWNSIRKAAEFPSFCNIANVLQWSDQSHSNYVSSWITWITSQPFGNLIISNNYPEYKLKLATLRIWCTMQCEQNSNQISAHIVSIILYKRTYKRRTLFCFSGQKTLENYYFQNTL